MIGYHQIFLQIKISEISSGDDGISVPFAENLNNQTGYLTKLDKT